MRRHTTTCFAHFAIGKAAALSFLLLAALLLAACGGPAPAESGESATPRGAAGGAAPTMPALALAQPTTMIDLTRMAQTTPAAAQQSAQADAEVGGQIYARHCAECHGAAGEGVADKGGAVAGMEMDEAALSTLLRTGGEYGPTHLFGIDKVSPDGIKALYAWMQALPATQ